MSADFEGYGWQRQLFRKQNYMEITFFPIGMSSGESIISDLISLDRSKNGEFLVVVRVQRERDLRTNSHGLLVQDFTIRIY